MKKMKTRALLLARVYGKYLPIIMYHFFPDFSVHNYDYDDDDDDNNNIPIIK